MQPLVVGLVTLSSFKLAVAVANESVYMEKKEDLALRRTPDRHGDPFVKRGHTSQSSESSKPKDKKRMPACSGMGCMWNGASVKESTVQSKQQRTPRHSKDTRSDQDVHESDSRPATMRHLIGRLQEMHISREGVHGHGSPSSTSAETPLARTKHYSQRFGDKKAISTTPSPEAICERPERSTLRSSSMSTSSHRTFGSFLGTPAGYEEDKSHSHRYDSPSRSQIDSGYSASAPVSPLASKTQYTPRNGEETPIYLTMQGKAPPTSPPTHNKKEERTRGQKLLDAAHKTGNLAVKTLPSQMIQTANHPQRSITPERRRARQPRRVTSAKEFHRETADKSFD